MANDKLLRVEGVQRTETFYILRTYKLSYRWGMSPEDEAALLSGETTYKDVRENAARICPNLL